MSRYTLTLSWDLVKGLDMVEDVVEVLHWDPYSINERGEPDCVTFSGDECPEILERLRQRMTSLIKVGQWVETLNSLIVPPPGGGRETTDVG